MFNAEVRAMLVEVLTSWQVIAVTVVILIYISIVRKAARIYIFGGMGSEPKRRKVKAAKADIPPPSESDDLGLEQEETSVQEEEIVD